MDEDGNRVWPALLRLQLLPISRIDTYVMYPHFAEQHDLSGKMFRYTELEHNERNTRYVGMTEYVHVAVVIVKEVSVLYLLWAFAIVLQCHCFRISEWYNMIVTRRCGWFWNWGKVINMISSNAVWRLLLVYVTDWYLRVGASQETCFCASLSSGAVSVKLASILHHDNGTCCLKVCVIAGVFADHSGGIDS